ncbi:hypothetical protein T06_13931, partial [Trichinella sp. T6]
LCQKSSSLGQNLGHWVKKVGHWVKEVGQWVKK